VNKTDLAGKFMQLQSNDLFQESMEGVLAGGTAGLGLAGTGIPLSQVALQTVGAIGGGIGIGMLGKYVGAAIGKKLHPQALKNQEGALAYFGRTTGQKTLTGGAVESLRYAKGQIKQELKQQTAAQLLNEALQNPQVFASKYGVDAETFKKYHSAVGIAGQVVAGLETLQNLPPEQRKQLREKAQQMMGQSFNQVENLINVHAAANMDNNIAKMAMLNKGKTIPGTEIDAGQMFGKLLKESKAVTGEHVGRAVGRFIGDEVGVVTGMAAGSLAAGALGIKTDKDKKIEDLERQLGRRS
jgi:hypothetical protein